MLHIRGLELRGGEDVADQALHCSLSLASRVSTDVQYGSILLTSVPTPCVLRVPRPSKLQTHDATALCSSLARKKAPQDPCKLYACKGARHLVMH
jgi:hypothetical protein